MDRDAFLARVRASLGDVATPEPPEPYRPPPARSREKMTDRLIRELEAVGGCAYRAASRDEARRLILDILTRCGTRKVIRGDTPLIRDLGLDAELENSSVEVTIADPGTDREQLRAAAFEADAGVTLDREKLRAAAFAADAGISSADFGVAETGTLALLAAPGQGRAVSLLPPVHVAVLHAGDIVYELAALFEAATARGALPSALTFVTGPSRTGDIEQTLTIGVHGPGELHVVVIG